MRRVNIVYFVWIAVVLFSSLAQAQWKPAAGPLMTR